MFDLKYSVRSLVCIIHCKAAFIKQVFPKLDKPTKPNLEFYWKVKVGYRLSSLYWAKQVLTWYFQSFYLHYNVQYLASWHLHYIVNSLICLQN